MNFQKKHWAEGNHSRLYFSPKSSMHPTSMPYLHACAGFAILLSIIAPVTRAQALDAAQKKRLDSFNGQALCGEVGRALRGNGPMNYRDAVVAKATNNDWIERQDLGYITSRRLRIGMQLCAVLAALGEPDTANKYVSASGTRYSFHYSAKRLLVSIDNDRVVSWSE
jgi:hypothetical protein